MHKCRNVGCNESFKWRMQLCRHETKCTKRRAAKSEAVIQSSDGYQCSKCGRTYKYKENVYRHFKICKQKPQINQQISNDVLICWKCHRPFISKELLDNHISQCNVFIDSSNDKNVMLVIPIDENLMQTVVSTPNDKIKAAAGKQSQSTASHETERSQDPSPSTPKSEACPQSVTFFTQPQQTYTPMFYPAVAIPTSKPSAPKAHPSSQSSSKPSSTVHNFPVDVKTVKRRVCGNCQRQFVRYDHFQRHVKKCGKLKKLTMEEIQQSLTCANCDRKYQRRDHYERHTKKCGSVNGGASFTNSSVNNISKHRMPSVPSQESNHLFNLSTILPPVKLSNLSPVGSERPNSGSMVVSYPTKHPISSLATSYLPLYSATHTPLYHHTGTPTHIFHEAYNHQHSSLQRGTQELPNDRMKAEPEQPKVEVSDIRIKEEVSEEEDNTLPSKVDDHTTRRCWKRALSANKVTVLSQHDDTEKEFEVKCKSKEYKKVDTNKKSPTKRSKSCADIAERLIDIHKSELQRKAVHGTEIVAVKSETLNSSKTECSSHFLGESSVYSKAEVAPVTVVSNSENPEDTEAYIDEECPTICLVTPEEEENLTPEKEKEFMQNISTALIVYLKKLYLSENSQNFHQMMNEIFHEQFTDQQFIYWLYKKFQS